MMIFMSSWRRIRVLALALVLIPLFLGASLSEVHGEPEAGATIEGKVDLGPPPKQPRLNKRYGGGGNAEGPALPLGPSPAVVYLEGEISGEKLSPPAEDTELLQKGLSFQPRVLPVLVGTTVSFPNEDDTYHNVFSYSKVKRFDLGRYRGRESIPTVTFDKPGAVRVFCEIHNHMRAVILVLESPHFTTTDGEGVYRLENIPPGKYILKAWVNEKKTFSREVELEAGETLSMSFGQK